MLSAKIDRPPYDRLKLIATGFAFFVLVGSVLALGNLVLTYIFEDNAGDVFWLIVVSLWLASEILTRRKLIKDMKAMKEDIRELKK